MAVVMPFNSSWSQYVVTNPGTSSFQAPWIDTRKCRTLFVHVSYASAVNSGASVNLKGTEDQTTNAFVTLVPTTAWQQSGSAVTITNGAAPIPSSSAGSLMLFYEYVPSYCSLVYIVASGGGALQVWIAGKST